MRGVDDGWEGVRLREFGGSLDSEKEESERSKGRIVIWRGEEGSSHRGRLFR